MIVFSPRTQAASLLLASSVILAACFQTDTPIEENKFPANYKKDIVDTITKLLDDPTNLRDTGLTDPALRPMAGATRYMSCVRFNPRNANHEYTGVVERVGYFYGGSLTQLVKPAGDECRGAAYKPFPELEKICFGTKCA
jgi:hypothetical protein